MLAMGRIRCKVLAEVGIEGVVLWSRTSEAHVCMVLELATGVRKRQTWCGVVVV
jgi:hypothetical protein